MATNTSELLSWITFDNIVVKSKLQLEIDTLYACIQGAIVLYTQLTIAFPDFDTEIQRAKHASDLADYFQELAFYLAYQDCEGVY